MPSESSGTIARMRGLFIDLDGTLADSLGILWQVYGDFLHEFDCTPTEQEFGRLNGLTLDEIINVLRECHGLPGTKESLWTFYNLLVDQAYERVKPLPGGLELLQQADALNWSVVVVTASTQVRSRRWLDQNGLLPYITEIISGEQATRGKPSPDLYLLALEKSGCRREDSFAVEDSPKGIQAARSAGLRTFAYAPDVVGKEGILGVEIVKDLRDLIVYLK